MSAVLLISHGHGAEIERRQNSMSAVLLISHIYGAETEKKNSPAGTIC
jgi:hypothetical protein